MLNIHQGKPNQPPSYTTPTLTVYWIGAYNRVEPIMEPTGEYTQTGRPLMRKVGERKVSPVIHVQDRIIRVPAIGEPFRNADGSIMLFTETQFKYLLQTTRYYASDKRQYDAVTLDRNIAQLAARTQKPVGQSSADVVDAVLETMSDEEFEKLVARRSKQKQAVVAASGPVESVLDDNDDYDEAAHTMDFIVAKAQTAPRKRGRPPKAK